MTKRLTIQVSDEFYQGLRRRVGQRGIGRFLEEVARPYVLRPEPGGPGWDEWLEDQYRQQAAQEAADPELAAEIREWIESGVGECLPDEDWSWLHKRSH